MKTKEFNLKNESVGEIELSDAIFGAEVTEGLLQVRTGSWRPGNASVRIRYRGAWFYVDDSDLPSKSTFSFLTQLLALQSGEVKSSAPVLTIPIGG